MEADKRNGSLLWLQVKCNWPIITIVNKITLCRLECKPEDGLLYFMLLRSSHLVQAYEAARKIVVSFVFATIFEGLCLE